MPFQRTTLWRGEASHRIASSDTDLVGYQGGNAGSGLAVGPRFARRPRVRKFEKLGGALRAWHLY